MSPPTILDEIKAELDTLQAEGLKRELRPITGPQGPSIRVAGRLVANFCSNNYLDLASHPALIAAAQAAMNAEGLGAGAARLISGNLECHRTLEVEVAQWKSTEAALVFSSGYHANLGILGALAHSGDVILSDQLNHASIIDGARLSRATIHVYPHCDLPSLAAALRAESSSRRRIVVTESLFSMDGDRAPLEAIAELAAAHRALLIVDDSHATGVYGDNGVGLAHVPGVHLQMGTFGKALGSFGAYVAGQRAFIDLLVNRARSFIFTTSLPVPVAAAARAAVALLHTPELHIRRTRLHNLTERLHSGLVKLELAPHDRSPSHIIPLVVGDPVATMALSDELLRCGFYVQGVRPPTVPSGLSRLRLTLMATHSDAQVDALLASLHALRDHFPRAS